MRLLRDTHIFLWFISGDARLPEVIRDRIRDPGNDVYLSVISVWEAIIKHQIGRLPLPQPPATYLSEQRKRHLISSLNLDEPSAMRLAKLPLLHRDPFGRILICQAIGHEMTVATADAAICNYAIETLR